MTRGARNVRDRAEMNKFDTSLPSRHCREKFRQICSVALVGLKPGSLVRKNYKFTRNFRVGRMEICFGGKIPTAFVLIPSRWKLISSMLLVERITLVADAESTDNPWFANLSLVVARELFIFPLFSFGTFAQKAKPKRRRRTVLANCFLCVSSEIIFLTDRIGSVLLHLDGRNNSVRQCRSVITC